MKLEKVEDHQRISFNGTADYVSPEVIEGQEVSFCCDIWALGCILYFMFEGRPPFSAKNEYIVYSNVLNKNVKFSEVLM